MVQYPRSYQRDRRIIEKEQNTNYTQVSLVYISKTNLIFFYGRCRVVHHALFLQVRQRAVASFLNPRLNEKPRDVHLYCTLMACGKRKRLYRGAHRRFWRYRCLRVSGQTVCTQGLAARIVSHISITAKPFFYSAAMWRKRNSRLCGMAFF